LDTTGKHPQVRACRAASFRVCSDQHASKGASQGQQAESVVPPSRKGQQDCAVHEQSGAKSSLSAGLIGLELTVRKGQVHVTDVLASTEGNISKGDRILEIASQPVGQTLACVDGLLQEVAQSDASRVHLRFVKTAGMGIFGASIESIHVPVQRRNDISAVNSSWQACEDPNACEDPRLSSLGIRWHVTNKVVAIRTVIAGTAAAKSANIMAGD
jgi:C-terminal processing protease CtpA/Prc